MAYSKVIIIIIIGATARELERDGEERKTMNYEVVWLCFILYLAPTFAKLHSSTKSEASIRFCCIVSATASNLKIC